MAIAINEISKRELASYVIWDYDGKCTMYFRVYASCSQSPTENYSLVRLLTRIEIVKKNPYHKGHSVTQVWTVGAGGPDGMEILASPKMTIDDKGIFYKSEKELSSPAFRVYHDSNGNGSSTVYYFFNGSETGAIGSQEAPYSVEITLPKIDRTAEKPTISNISSTFNSASCDIRVPFESTVNQYSTDGSNWTEWNKSVSENRTFSHTWSGLKPNTTYTFYYRFRRDYNEVWSPTVSFTVTTTKPAAPTKGTVSVSTKTYNSITYSWSGFSFGAGGSWGKYQYSYDDSSWVDTGQNTSHTRSNLSPNTNYTLYVRLVDNYGTASPVAFVTGTTDKPAAPAAPTKGSVSVSNITYNGAKFTWSGFSLGADATLDKYQYKCQDQDWIDCGINTSVTITDRSPNTSYTFYVRMVDNYGQVSDSATVSFTTTKPSAGDATGILINATSTSNSVTIGLSGGTPADGASIAYYRIDFNDSGYKRVSNPVTFTDLSPNTTYYFYVDFVDNYGTTASGSTFIAVTTKNLDTPSKGTVTVSNITESSAVFSWSGFGFGAGATWGYYRYSTNGSNWISCGTDVMATLTGLSANTSYTFYVQLVDNYGQASASATVTFKTKAINAWKCGKYGAMYIKVGNI